MSGPVLVTGGAGYIGSHIVLALLDAGKKPIILDNLSTGDRSVIPAGVPFVEGDSGDKTVVANILRQYDIKSVIHCAGTAWSESAEADPLLYYRNNTSASRALIEACIENGVTYFVFSSTGSVYGVPSVYPIPDTVHLNPVNAYGRSKMMTEMMLDDVGQAAGLHWAAVRYFNVSGADPGGRSGQTGPMSRHLIRRALRVSLGLIDRIEIFGTDYPTPDGTCLRDYVHVTDLADAHVLCLDYLMSGGASRRLNCGYGYGFSVRDVLKTVEDVTSKKLSVVEKARRPGDPPILVADATWLRETLGWKPRFEDLGRIATDALRWERFYMQTHLGSAAVGAARIP